MFQEALGTVGYYWDVVFFWSFHYWYVALPLGMVLIALILRYFPRDIESR
jgi:hypothetical protein